MIEVVVVIAVVAVVSFASIGLIAALAKRGEPGVNRDLALMVAQNTLERARVAAAYLPLAKNAAEDAYVKPYMWSQAKDYILAASAAFTVPAKLPTATCGATAAANATIPLAVTTTLSGNVFAVSVRYPINACDQRATATVDLSEVLPPSAFIPGTRVYQQLDNEPTAQ